MIFLPFQFFFQAVGYVAEFFFVLFAHFAQGQMGVENVESLLLGIQVNGRGVFSTQGGTYLLYFSPPGGCGRFNAEQGVQPQAFQGAQAAFARGSDLDGSARVPMKVESMPEQVSRSMTIRRPPEAM